MYVRLAGLEDCADLFEWRNDLHTRRMSHSSSVISWSEHKTWYEATLKNISVCLLVCVDNTSKKFGVVRFDIEDDIAEVSINLNPGMRGKGKGKECLEQAIEYLKSRYPSVRRLNAEIKVINIQSKRTFEGIGFVIESKTDEICHYTLLL